MWARGRSLWAGAPGTLRCPLKQLEPHSSINSRRRSHSGHSSASARLAALRGGERRGGGARASRAEPSRARSLAAAAARRCHHSNKELAEPRAEARACLETAERAPRAGRQPEETRGGSGGGAGAEDGQEERAPQHQG